jgi:hypothetical protein
VAAEAELFLFQSTCFFNSYNKFIASRALRE